MKKPLLIILGPILLLTVGSCKDRSAKNKLLGSWIFEKATVGDKTEETADMKKMFELTFTAKNEFVSVTITDGKRDTVRTGTYDLSEGGKMLIVKSNASPEGDSINILDLNDKILKTREQRAQLVTEFRRK